MIINTFTDDQRFSLLPFSYPNFCYSPSKISTRKQFQVVPQLPCGFSLLKVLSNKCSPDKCFYTHPHPSHWQSGSTCPVPPKMDNRTTLLIIGMEIRVPTGSNLLFNVLKRFLSPQCSLVRFQVPLIVTSSVVEIWVSLPPPSSMTLGPPFRQITRGVFFDTETTSLCQLSSVVTSLSRFLYFLIGVGRETRVEDGLEGNPFGPSLPQITMSELPSQRTRLSSHLPSVTQTSWWQIQETGSGSWRNLWSKEWEVYSRSKTSRDSQRFKVVTYFFLINNQIVLNPL